MKKFIFFLVFAIAFILIICDSEAVKALLITKVAGFGLLAIDCLLWQHWKLDNKCNKLND